MYKNNDKITLTINNVMDLEGNILPCNIVLPINENITLPNETVQVSIFEYQEGNLTGGHIAFNIYVGEIKTIEALIYDKINNNKKFDVNSKLEIHKLDTPLCCKTIDNGKIFVFAKVTENDIVVNNLAELKEKLYEISGSFLQVKEGLSIVKKLKYKRTVNKS